jgi:hypothetical protein
VMKIEKFSEYAKLSDHTEIAKAERLVLFLTRELSLHECSIKDLLDAFESLHFSRPNPSRLKRNVAKSSRFLKAKSEDHIRLHAKTVAELRGALPELFSKSEEISSDGTLLPKGIYDGVPSYVKRLADQVNACYEHNIFDGCAVLMRRLLEIVLIRTYEKLGLQSRIRGSDGNFKMLEAIVTDAKSGNHLSLSRNTKDKLDDFRALGNFAAHKIEFSTRRGDVDRLILDYRASIEELLLKSGLKQ